jgi:hypothetical protein
MTSRPRWTSNYRPPRSRGYQHDVAYLRVDHRNGQWSRLARRWPDGLGRAGTLTYANLVALTVAPQTARVVGTVHHDVVRSQVVEAVAYKVCRHLPVRLWRWGYLSDYPLPLLAARDNLPPLLLLLLGKPGSSRWLLLTTVVATVCVRHEATHFP